jgi:hypothetical protein
MSRFQVQEQTLDQPDGEQLPEVGLRLELERRATAAADTVSRLRAQIRDVRAAERERYERRLREVVESMRRDLEEAVEFARASERAEAEEAIERERERLEEQLAAVRREAEIELAETVARARDEERERVLAEVEEHLPRYLNDAI